MPSIRYATYEDVVHMYGSLDGSVPPQTYGIGDFPEVSENGRAVYDAVQAVLIDTRAAQGPWPSEERFTEVAAGRLTPGQAHNYANADLSALDLTEELAINLRQNAAIISKCGELAFLRLGEPEKSVDSYATLPGSLIENGPAAISSLVDLLVEVEGEAALDDTIAMVRSYDAMLLKHYGFGVATIALHKFSPTDIERVRRGVKQTGKRSGMTPEKAILKYASDASVVLGGSRLLCQILFEIDS